MRNWAENQMILVLIRHGETKANREKRYLGKTEESLSEYGKKQLLSYRMQNLYPTVEYLFTSPKKRCIETANIIYPMLNPMMIPEWEEIDFGRFEYKNYKELKKDNFYQIWIDSGGTLPFPEGESREDFILRCQCGLKRMCHNLSKVRKQKQQIFVGAIVHGGTIMALLSSYGKKQYFDYQTLNGRGYLCRVMGWDKQIQIKEIRIL